MKRFAVLLSTFCITTGYAVDLKVTKIIPTLNIYIFDDKYVVESKFHIDHLKEGDIFDLEIEKFYDLDGWVQGKLVKYLEDPKVDLLSLKNWFEYATMFNSGGEELRHFYHMSFKPLGIIKNGPIKLKEFKKIILNTSGIDLIERSRFLHADDGPFPSPESIRENYTTEGVEFNILDLIDKYGEIAPKFSTEIYKVYRKDKPHELAALINLSVKPKFLCKDHVDGVAYMLKKEEVEDE